MEQHTQQLPAAIYKPHGFRHWHDAGFGEWLLPIAPPGSNLSRLTKIDPS